MLFAEDEKVVEALAGQGLGPALCERIQVGRARRQHVQDMVLGLEDFLELRRVLAVPVVDQVDGLATSVLQVHVEVPCLLRHPRAARAGRDPGDVHMARRDVDVEENEAVHEARLGKNSARYEVAGPEGLGVTLYELGPGIPGSLWARVEAILHQDVLHRAVADITSGRMGCLGEEEDEWPGWICGYGRILRKSLAGWT